MVGEGDKHERVKGEITCVTLVTRWRVPEAKCPRRYGAISAQLLKNPVLVLTPSTIFGWERDYKTTILKAVDWFYSCTLRGYIRTSSLIIKFSLSRSICPAATGPQRRDLPMMLPVVHLHTFRPLHTHLHLCLIEVPQRLHNLLPTPPAMHSRTLPLGMDICSSV
jgi:hypothetical protein